MPSNPTEQAINKLNNLSVCPTCPIKVQNAVIISAEQPKLKISFKNLSASKNVQGLSFTIIYHLTEHRSARSKIHIKNALLEPSHSRACSVPLSYEESRIVSYEILVNEITLADGRIIEFSESEYIPREAVQQSDNKSAKPTHTTSAKLKPVPAKANNIPDKKKKLYTVITIIGGLLILECIAGFLIAYRVWIYPEEKLSRDYTECLEDKRYDDAIALADENNDEKMRQSIAAQAVEYYFSENSIPEAVKYADMLENFDDSEYYDVIFAYYADGHIEEGLSYAKAHSDDSEIIPYLREFYENAVTDSIEALDKNAVISLADHALNTQHDKLDLAAIFTEAAADAFTDAGTSDEYELNLELHEKFPDSVLLSQETVQSAVTHYSALHDYDTALDFAAYSTNSESLRNSIIDSAVEYYNAPETMDQEKLLKYAIQLENEKSGDIIREAIDYFIEKWESSDDPFAYREEIENCEKNAPEDIKTEIQIKAKTVYLKMFARAGRTSYNDMKATLKLLDSLSHDAASEFVNSLPHSDIIANYPNFSSYLTAETKRQLLASPIGVFKYCVGIGENGASVGETELGWTDLVSLDASEHAIVGLTASGTVLTHGDGLSGEADTVSWSNIVDIGSGLYHTVGLLADGTVVASGSNENGQCNVTNLRNIVDIAVGNEHTVCLRSDGSVAAVGLNSSGQCEVSSWTDIIAVAAGTYHTVGLKSDGTVVCAGSTALDKCATENWSDIVAVSAGDCMTVGLKKDGTVVVTGRPLSGSIEGADKWTNIRGIYAGSVCILGLKDDGSVVAVGDGAPDVSKLTGLRLNVDPRE